LRTSPVDLKANFPLEIMRIIVISAAARRASRVLDVAGADLFLSPGDERQGQMDRRQRHGRRGAGPTGLVWGVGGADERGLFDLVPLDDAAAQAAMAEVRLAE
jgi:hypothetical protein